MMQSTRLSCRCGKVHLELEGASFVNAECCCNSCREAAVRLEALPGSASMRELNGTTRYVFYRKDRIVFSSGQDLLGEFRLTPKSSNRRVVATCCNTPLFLEFNNAHWLSLYGKLWPEGTLPPLDIRTMVMDRPDGSPALADDVPNTRRQNLAFFAAILRAWIAMGFRSPKIAVQGVVDA